jgi:hypothetical protein
MKDAWNSVVVLYPLGGAKVEISYDDQVEPTKYCKFTLHDAEVEVNDECRSTWNLYTPSEAKVKVELPLNVMPVPN